MSRSSSQRASAQKDDGSGFDSIAAILDQMLLDQMPKKKSAPTSTGLTNTAYRELKTSFSASLKLKPKAVADASAPRSTTVTPSPANAPRRSKRTSSVDSTPLQPNQLDSTSYRYDECLVPLSTESRGVRRMRHRDVLRLRKGEYFTLVIPTASDRSDHKRWRHQRQLVLDDFKWIIGDAAPRGERVETIEADLKQRAIMRQDKEFLEFNVRVHSYPERPRLEQNNLPEGEINDLIDATAGVGIYVELRGYGSRNTALIKLFAMPYLEFYQARKPHEPYLDESISFVRGGNMQRAIDHMACELHSLKGDTAAYVEITVNRDGENVNDGLKKLGNVKKRKMSSFILLDLLGKDGRDALDGVAESHNKSIKTEKRKIAEVKKAVLHFESKMQRRRKTLADNMAKSENKTYYRCDDWWLSDYEQIMSKKRKK